MAYENPQHPKITPEEAARLIKQNGESELLTAEEIASSLRDHVDEFGPSELESGGITYTVELEDDDEPEPVVGGEPLFELGAVVATPGALRVLGEAEVAPSGLLTRHASGDWGEVDAHDRRANNKALKDGTRLLSAYILPSGERVWIITEADRSSTCILLPSEY